MDLLEHPSTHLLFNLGFHQLEGDVERTTVGTFYEVGTVIIASCKGHANRDGIILGPGSAKVISRHGDSHFWVFRCHKYSGDVCFLV